ncbi:hypothetical protein CQ046_18845 [Chryseobacterium sp. MYb7]|uniref:lipase family protein n=1 Tax=Chryseobacterium sp. MYb7 TaxID=1827290 RepID=UPI000CFEFAE9|nr:hypothetical protein [Chryseobacterium sp. MYb7]PRB00381.1 hypothetical protein CQ046_18845 [Chryseobacterium sp. MYb7]
MTNPSLDAYQQVFGMAGLANRAGGYNGFGIQLQQQLQYDLSYYFNNVPPVKIMDQKTPSTANPSAVSELGNWDLVWGPALIEEKNEKGIPTGVADNALYVVKSNAVAFPGGPTLPTYVVAIAATNPSSLYDWETEDFSVAEVVNWTTYNPSNFSPSPYNGTDPYISKGTATGISILLGLESPNSAASPNTTLQQFLAGLNPDPGTAIVFCGHSLAGALSPTLALYLKENKDLNAFGVTLVYPTAGPTPGETAFANLFNSKFPPLPPGWQQQTGTYQSWNTMHWNNLDVVPHAWTISELGKIATIYGQAPTFMTAGLLNALQKMAIDDSSKSGASYTRIQNQSLPGQLQHSSGSISIKTPPETLQDYIFQLSVQHVGMYNGIPAAGSNPQVNGLILPQPLPKPAVKLVPGVTAVTELEMILKIIDQIIGWISSNYVLVEKENVTQNASADK